MGEYYLIAVDSKYDMIIARRLESDKSSYIGRIDRTVFAVGHDNRFIIAKQQPEGKPSKVNYFIIDTFSDSDHAEKNNSVIGPLNEEEFIKKFLELGVRKDIKFSNVK